MSRWLGRPLLARCRARVRLMENRAVSADEKKPESTNRKTSSVNWSNMAIRLGKEMQGVAAV